MLWDEMRKKYVKPKIEWSLTEREAKLVRAQDTFMNKMEGAEKNTETFMK